MGFFRPVLSLLAIAVLDDKAAVALFRRFDNSTNLEGLGFGDGTDNPTRAIAQALNAVPQDVEAQDLFEASRLVMRFTFCGDLQ